MRLLEGGTQRKGMATQPFLHLFSAMDKSVFYRLPPLRKVAAQSRDTTDSKIMIQHLLHVAQKFD